MKVEKKSYNVITIDCGVVTPGTAKVIGTNADYQMVKAATTKSGILRMKAVVSDFPIMGTFSVNPWQLEDKLECTCVTNVGGTLTVCVATLEPSDDGFKGTLVMTTLS